MALRAEGQRVRVGHLSVVYLEEPGSSDVRVAYAIGKRVGTAVARNRLRRRLRALVADQARRGALPAGALLLSAGPAASDRDADELSADVDRLVSALSARLDRVPA